MKAASNSKVKAKMGSQGHDSRRRSAYLGVLVTVAYLTLLLPAMAAPSDCGPVTGAIWTTDSEGKLVDQNLYANKEDVFLNGGPDRADKHLPDGDYYVRVTEPGGGVLGSSNYAVTATYRVVNGTFSSLLQLWSVLTKASDGTAGYDDTGNPGGEYKVWVSTDPSFSNSCSKTDNFKVARGGGGTEDDGNGGDGTGDGNGSNDGTGTGDGNDGGTGDGPGSDNGQNGGSDNNGEQPGGGEGTSGDTTPPANGNTGGDTTGSTNPPADNNPPAQATSVLGETVTPAVTAPSVDTEASTTSVLETIAAIEPAPARDELPYTGMNGASAMIALLFVAAGAFMYGNGRVVE